MKKIYVACASAEMDRAKSAIAAVRAMGYEVTADWAAHVEKIGIANPSEDDLRREAALFDLKGVEAAEIFWLCFPMEKDRGYGTGPELGAAITLRRVRSSDFCSGQTSPIIIVSGGDTRRSIFPVLADYEVATDEEALKILASLL